MPDGLQALLAGFERLRHDCGRFRHANNSDKPGGEQPQRIEEPASETPLGKARPPDPDDLNTVADLAAGGERLRRIPPKPIAGENHGLPAALCQPLAQVAKKPRTDDVIGITEMVEKANAAAISVREGRGEAQFTGEIHLRSPFSQNQR